MLYGGVMPNFRKRRRRRRCRLSNAAECGGVGSGGGGGGGGGVLSNLRVTAQLDGFLQQASRDGFTRLDHETAGREMMFLASYSSLAAVVRATFQSALTRPCPRQAAGQKAPDFSLTLRHR